MNTASPSRASAPESASREPSQGSNTAQAPAPTTRTVLVSRVLTPIFIGLVALVQIVVGVDALPLWLQTMAARLGLDSMILIKSLIGLELAAAVLMLLMAGWARGIATTVLSAACFAMVAEIAAVKGGPGLAWRIILLLVPAGLLALLSMGKGGRDRSGAGGPVFLAVLGVAAAAAVAWAVQPPPGKLTIEPEVSAVQLTELMRDIPREQLPAKLYMNEPDVWVGSHVSALEWAPYVPQEMLDDLATGTHLVMFYHPDSELANLVFQEHIASAAPMPCWAVRVPRNSATGAGPQYPPSRLPSPNSRLACLPPGPFWFFWNPTMIRVDDGVVSCFSAGKNDVDYEQCLAGHQSAPPPGS